MSDELAAALVGLCGVIGVALIQWLVSRRRSRLEEVLLQLDIAKQSQEINGPPHAMPSAASGGKERTVYRSTGASAPGDFEPDASASGLRKGAEGSWSYTEGVLRFERTNQAGEVWVKLSRYQTGAADAEVLPGDWRGTVTTMRVSCEARAIGGHQTLVFLLKSPGDPSGVHLGADQRIRIRRDEFIGFEASFTYPAEKSAYLRIVARSPSAANSTLELRNIVVSVRTAMST